MIWPVVSMLLVALVAVIVEQLWSTHRHCAELQAILRQLEELTKEDK